MSSGQRDNRTSTSFLKIGNVLILCALLLCAYNKQVGAADGYSGGSIGGGRNAETFKQLLDATSYENAKCLDGTPGAFYLNANPGNNTWIIYLNGGGECTDVASCTGRSKTELGSSTLLPKTIWTNYGLLDTTEEQNLPTK